MAVIGPLKLKVQLFRGDEPAIGPGKALVLEAIAREGSISAAGRSLGMSYRRTWLLVDSLNRCWREPAVAAQAGGGAQGGARLTPFGQELLRRYRAMEARVADASRGEDLDWLLAARNPDG